jgi:hypothetical protein
MATPLQAARSGVSPQIVEMSVEVPQTGRRASEARLVPQPLLDANGLSVIPTSAPKKWSRRSDCGGIRTHTRYAVAESGRYLESGHEPFQ